MMENEMNDKLKIIEELKKETLETFVPVLNMSLESIIDIRVEGDMEARLGEEKYKAAINNPTMSNFAPEFLKATRKFGIDKYEKIREHMKLVGSSIDDIAYEKFEQITMGKGLNKESVERVVKASMAYEGFRRSNIRPEEMEFYLKDKLNKAIRGDYLSYLWRVIFRSRKYL